MERFAEKYFTETYTDKTRKGKLRLPAGGQGRKDKQALNWHETTLTKRAAQFS